MVITSNSNPQIVLLKKLQSDGKFRKKYGAYCIEGERLVKEAVKFGKKLSSVYVKESVAEYFAAQYGVTPTVVSDAVFAHVSDTVHDQGILATVELPSGGVCAPLGNCLVLENVRDPGNMGTLLRTAAAVGISDVYTIDCVDAYSPKVLRSAMSAHFALNLHDGSKEEVFEAVSGNFVVCADMGGDDVFDFTVKQPFALVLGNEGNGLTEFARSHCNATVSLPMKNNIESLNVSVAGSILMYLLAK